MNLSFNIPICHLISCCNRLEYQDFKSSDFNSICHYPIDNELVNMSIDETIEFLYSHLYYAIPHSLRKQLYVTTRRSLSIVIDIATLLR